MKPKFYSMRVFFFSLLLLIGIGNAVNGQTIHLTVEDFTSGGDGTIATLGDVLIYTATVTGTSTPTTNTTLKADVPAGTVYVTGSTTVNGTAVADVNGAMPFAAGALINSNGALPGTLNADDIITVVFQVRVTANAGAITGNADFTGINGPAPVGDSYQTTTNITVDGSCNLFFQVNGSTPTANGGSTASPYLQVKLLNITTGVAGATVYNGPTGTGKDAFNGSNISSLFSNVSAIAFDQTSRRLYFVNNAAVAPLCYIDLSGSAPYTAFRFTGMPLETNTAAGYNITRMTNGIDGKLYALTENGLDLISFYINAGGLPAITRLGALINDVSNGTHDVLAEASGDIIADGSGKLHLIPTSGNVYSIDPATRIAKYAGTIAGMPTRVTNSAAIDYAGNIYIGGAYATVYRVSLTAMTATPISAVGVWTSGDFASCGLPVQPLRVATNVNTNANNAEVPGLNEQVFAKVQPNPFHKELNLQVQLKTAENVKVRLIDFHGRTVYAATEKLGAGMNSLRLPVPAELASGLYVVELWAGNNRLLQKKLVKQ